MTVWDAITIAAVFIVAGGLTVLTRAYWRLRERYEMHITRHPAPRG